MWVTLFSSSKITSSYLVLTLIILGIGLLFIFSEGIIVSVLKKQIDARFLKYIELFTAILLLYFACKFGYELVTIIMQL
jgi:TRAP-type C4-dicarboxylate transport system permease small subunit